MKVVKNATKKSKINATGCDEEKANSSPCSSKRYHTICIISKSVL